MKDLQVGANPSLLGLLLLFMEVDSAFLPLNSASVCCKASCLISFHHEVFFLWVPIKVSVYSDYKGSCKMGTLWLVNSFFRVTFLHCNDGRCKKAPFCFQSRVQLFLFGHMLVCSVTYLYVVQGHTILRSVNYLYIKQG